MMIEIGTTLANGATVLKVQETYDGWIVLAAYRGVQPFVTWRVNPDGDSYWGHYFADVLDAHEDFLVRTSRGMSS